MNKLFYTIILITLFLIGIIFDSSKIIAFAFGVSIPIALVLFIIGLRNIIKSKGSKCKMIVHKKGTHRAEYKPFPFIYRNKTLSYRFQFNVTCIYEDEKLHYRENKLFGFSHFFHHRNSARFAWRYDIRTGLINIYAYHYEKGKRRSIFLTSVNIDEDIDLTLKLSHGYVYYFINDTKVHSHKFKKLVIGYRLWAWFGGKYPAPHYLFYIRQKNIKV